MNETNEHGVTHTALCTDACNHPRQGSNVPVPTCEACGAETRFNGTWCPSGCRFTEVVGLPPMTILDGEDD